MCIKKTYKASPGKFVLVEKYLGANDQTFEVASTAEASRMRHGLAAALECVDAIDFAKYLLYDESGNEIPIPS